MQTLQIRAFILINHVAPFCLCSCRFHILPHSASTSKFSSFFPVLPSHCTTVYHLLSYHNRQVQIVPSIMWTLRCHPPYAALKQWTMVARSSIRPIASRSNFGNTSPDRGSVPIFAAERNQKITKFLLSRTIQMTLYRFDLENSIIKIEFQYFNNIFY